MQESFELRDLHLYTGEYDYINSGVVFFQIMGDGVYCPGYIPAEYVDPYADDAFEEHSYEDDRNYERLTTDQEYDRRYSRDYDDRHREGADGYGIERSGFRYADGYGGDEEYVRDREKSRERYNCLLNCLKPFRISCLFYIMYSRNI